MTTFDKSGINQIEIQGSAKDIVCRKTAKGSDWVALRLTWEGERDKLWIGVTWFGGEKAAALAKENPSVVLVRGRVITNSYDSKKNPGDKVFEIKIMASEIKAVAQEAQEPAADEPVSDDDLPF